MRRLVAILLTLGIVLGMPVGITLLVGRVVSEDVTGVVAVLVGAVFGTFALVIYRVLRGDSR